MDKNLQKFREVFLEESREHLETMESCRLGLEAGAAADGETLNRIFRSAHTIKGGSAMFGLEDTARFTHGLENLLDQVRGGAIGMTRELVDTLLRACDVLKLLLAGAQTGGAAPPQMESVLEAIQGAAAPAPETGPTAPPSEPKHGGMRSWQVALTPAPDAFLRGLDPLLALRELAELGIVSNLQMDTSAVPSLTALDPERSYLRWTLTLDTTEPENRIREVFEFLHDGSGLDLRETEEATETPAVRLPITHDPTSALPPAESPAAATPAAPPMPPRITELASAAAPPDSGSTIRVDVDLLDRLMNQVGELMLARNQLLQFSGATDDAALTAASQRLNLITSELQEGVMKTRMQPIGVAWSMMPRLIRDLAQTVGKQIHLEMEGSETELDRTIIEAIKDPLTHLVRNCCDHGLETPEERVARHKPAQGRLLMRAFHEGGHVIIEITDDGRGIDVTKVKEKAIQRGLISAEQAARMTDRDAVHLVFLPGFSTAEQVSNISGRGVGMDVVKTNIERISGAVDLSSKPGAGTTVRIKIPLTLAIIPGMVVEGGEQRFVIPQVSLVELVRFDEDQVREKIERIHGTSVCRLRGKLLPLIHLNEVLKIGKISDKENEPVSIVVLQAEERQFGLVVDVIRDTQEIVVKPLGRQLKGIPAYSGATVMGDGRVALILDVLGLAQLAGFAGSSFSGEAHGAEKKESTSQDHDKQTLLLFRCPGHPRMAVPLALVSRLEEFPKHRVEYTAGRPAVQYRERILPLIALDDSFEKGHLPEKGGSIVSDSLERDTGELLEVIVFIDGTQGVGLLVSDILDVVEERVVVRKESQQPGILGTAVVGGELTDFLDIATVLSNAGETWQNTPSSTVLVAHPSPFQRALLRNSLEMSGHHVVEASTGAEVLTRLDQAPVHLVALSTDLEQALGGGSLLALIRKHTGDAVPVMAIDSDGIHSASRTEFDAVLGSQDRPKLAATIRSLLKNKTAA